MVLLCSQWVQRGWPDKTCTKEWKRARREGLVIRALVHAQLDAPDAPNQDAGNGRAGCVRCSKDRPASGRRQHHGPQRIPHPVEMEEWPETSCSFQIYTSPPPSCKFFFQLIDVLAWVYSMFRNYIHKKPTIKINDICVIFLVFRYVNASQLCSCHSLPNPCQFSTQPSDIGRIVLEDLRPKHHLFKKK